MNIIDEINIDTLTKFIMPMVFKNNIKYSNIQQKIYSTHLSVFDKPEYDDKIIIVSSYKIPEELYLSTVYIKSITSLLFSNKQILNILNIPTEYYSDFEHCITGRYSKLSDDYKRKLLYFWSEDKDSKLFATLYKDKKKRFDHNEHSQNHIRIKYAIEYYSKPKYYELIYGLNKGEY